MSAGAFFDVDETLVATKSMFSFLRYHLSRRGEGEAGYERAVRPLTAAAAAGKPRAEVNRLYYALFAGESVHRLTLHGRGWFAEHSARPGFFVRPTLSELERHRAQADPVYLISGSFFACLDPVAEAVGATGAVGTRPHVRRGLLTGEVVQPVIGVTKAVVAGALCSAHRLDPSRCSAYGDHPSDLPLLEMMGDPVVVGDDPDLWARAERDGWRVLGEPAWAAGRGQE